MPISSSFEEIVDQFSEKIYNHALRILGNRYDAEEATQDVFIRVYKSADSFRGEATLSTWIWRITVNVCYSRAAKSRLDTSSLEIDTIESISDADPDPESQVIRNETRDEIAAAISRLPLLEATAITLFYLEEMGYNEISRILDIPAGTVATSLHRGRERLRRILIPLDSGRPQ